MIFPGLLISIFFLTLNFNHSVLYAPSDFKDEDNFLKLFGKPTFEEKLLKLETEFGNELLDDEENGEIDSEHPIVHSVVNNPPTDENAGIDNAEIPDSATINPPTSTLDDVPAFLRSALKKSKSTEVSPLLIQDLVLTKLSREFETFDKERVVRTSKANFLFDAVAYKNGQVFAIEVHRLSSSESLSNLLNVLNEIISVLSELNNPNRGGVKLILALIVNKQDDFETNISTLKSVFEYTNFEYEIRKFEYEPLRTEILVRSKKP